MSVPLRIDDGRQTLVLVQTDGLPVIGYWGPSLPADEHLGQVALAGQMDLTGGMLDRLAPMTLCPVGDGHWQGQPALEMVDDKGADLVPRFGPAVVVIDGATATIEASGGGVTYRARLAFEGGLLLMSSAVETDRPARLRWLAAPVLPVAAGLETAGVFSGRWIGEMILTEHRIGPGAILREGRGGRSGQEVPPFVLLTGKGTTNTHGAALALAYAWPGAHRMIVEELPCGRRQVQFGHAAGSELALGTRFETGVLAVARSDAGLNGCAVLMQAHVRDRLVPWPDRARPRPVHYNCWEAVYFRHDLTVLADMAKRAARVGAERFVLDDGWFGRRDDDTSSLGDWVVDQRKWPRGLQPLIDAVKAEGMSFGLWVEPEMANADSDLYRAHPDWILGAPDQVTGRGQLVLDLGLKEVRDYLFGRLDTLLTEYDIDYLKWDHNRLLPVNDAAQGRGILELLAQLRAVHPGVEIESCASGGGRIDFGMLAQTCRVWLSDCIDAQERLRMQHAAALFLPSAVTGSHVGAEHSHTTGRALPIGFRAWMAAQRHMGFEMDLRVISPQDEAVLARVTGWYKANRAWMMAGDIRRLDSDDPDVTAEIQVSADGGRFVVFAGVAGHTRQVLPRPLRLTGLDVGVRYRVRLVNPEDRAPQSRGPLALKDGPLDVSGEVLMQAGLMLPVAWPSTMWVVEGERL